MPAAKSNLRGLMRVESQRPTNTPKKLVVTNADPAPANTTQGEWDSAAISRVVTWVLSPNSASRIVTKVVAKTFQADWLVVVLAWGAGSVVWENWLDSVPEALTMEGAELSVTGSRINR